jgi:hypothetical protein
MLLPGALIAGVMGMNFKVGLFEEPALFWAVLAVIVLIAPVTIGLPRQDVAVDRASSAVGTPGVVSAIPISERDPLSRGLEQQSRRQLGSVKPVLVQRRGRFERPRFHINEPRGGCMSHHRGILR